MRDAIGQVVLDRDEHMRPGTTAGNLGNLKPSFDKIGQMGGFDAVAIRGHPQVEALRHVHTAGNSSGIVDGACGILIGS